jgi:hypothetical protein
LVQKVPTPVHGGLKRCLALGAPTAATDKKSKPGIQHPFEFVDTHVTEPASRELNRKWNAIEVTADGPDLLQITFVEHKIGTTGPRSIDEQLNCVSYIAIQGKGRHPKDELVFKLKRFSTCCQHGKQSALTQQQIGHVCAGVDYVFTVVKNHQALSVAEIGDKHFLKIGRLSLDAGPRRNGSRHQNWIGHRCQVNKKDTVAIAPRDASSGLDSEPCFPSATHSCESDESLTFEKPENCLQLAVSANE